MKQTYSNTVFKSSFFSKNWEANIDQVSVEPCDEQEDPLGYRAIFFVNEGIKRAGWDKTFVIGASYLAQREHNLSRAGYKAPMTHRAINLIEQKIGSRLPVVLA